MECFPAVGTSSFENRAHTGRDLTRPRLADTQRRAKAGGLTEKQPPSPKEGGRLMFNNILALVAMPAERTK
jgi:hypothetical protein